MKLSFYAEQLLVMTISEQVKIDLLKYIDIVGELRLTSSKLTHYDRINE